MSLLPDKIESLWIGTTLDTDYPKLEPGLKVDVIVIGAGIAGLNVGYFLRRLGLKVAIIDSGKIATGTSGNTTAKVTSQHGLKYAFLKENFGLEKAKIYAEANEWAIDELEKIVKKENIDCDLTRLPAYVYAMEEDGLKEILKEVETAKEIGLPVSFIKKIEGLQFSILGAIKFENQAYFHPRKYLLALAEKIKNKGGYIFEKTEAFGIKEGEGNTVITENVEIKARYVVVATNFPFYKKEFFSQYLYRARSYGLAAQLNNSLPEGEFIGKDGNRLSFRKHKSGEKEWSIIGGESHDLGMEENIDHFSRLEKTAAENFSLKEIDYKWAAEDTMTKDRLPYIGAIPGSKNTFVITGFAKWGITTSFVAAKIITDLISGKTNEWESLYSPSRIKSISVFEKFKNMFKGLFKEKKEDYSDLSVGSGKIVSINGEKIAAYKDERGEIHFRSAACTHLGCIVGWNKNNKTWDCPCHGSRFNKNGEVINGPALKPLSEIK